MPPLRWPGSRHGSSDDDELNEFVCGTTQTPSLCPHLHSPLSSRGCMPPLFSTSISSCRFPSTRDTAMFPRPVPLPLGRILTRPPIPSCAEWCDRPPRYGCKRPHLRHRVAPRQGGADRGQDQRSRRPARAFLAAHSAPSWPPPPPFSPVLSLPLVHVTARHGNVPTTCALSPEPRAGGPMLLTFSS